MKLIDLSIRAKNPDYYDRSRDIETALAWNAVKKTLIEAGREELFEHIQSIRLTEKYMIITTGRQIVNAEIRLYAEKITTRYIESIEKITGKSIL
jgi:hypothetical protein